MWELDCEESWAPKYWCFWTVVLEKTPETSLDRKEIQPVHSKGYQPWVFFGRNDAIAETPVLWPPHARSWLIGKDSDAGRDMGAGGKGDDRRWDVWMSSLTRWTWVWVNSGSWWWTGRPGVRFMGSQRVRHDWATELTDWLSMIVSHNICFPRDVLKEWSFDTESENPNTPDCCQLLVHCQATQVCLMTLCSEGGNLPFRN